MLDVATQVALSTRKLTLAYDGNVIIQGLDLAIPQGQITTLVGPNGCGKSTLLRGLARLLKPRGGTVYLEGDAIAHLPTKKIRQAIGYFAPKSHRSRGADGARIGGAGALSPSELATAVVQRG